MSELCWSQSLSAQKALNRGVKRTQSAEVGQLVDSSRNHSGPQSPYLSNGCDHTCTTYPTEFVNRL